MSEKLNIVRIYAGIGRRKYKHAKNNTQNRSTVKSPSKIIMTRFSSSSSNGTCHEGNSRA